MRRGILSGLQPLHRSALAVAGARQMTGEKFGLDFDEFAKLLLENGRDAAMQLLPPATQQRAVSRVLYQCMLEQIGGRRRQPAPEQKARFGQPLQRGFEIRSVSDAMDES